MNPPASITVVIIARNEAAHIADCVRAARRLSNDVLVIDSGSTDATPRLAALCGARVHAISWQGYGAARNTGAALARHDWILALDADERPDERLRHTLQTIRLHRQVVYRFRRRNHWGECPIRFGTLGFERCARLYHRGDAHWNHFAVHERLTGSFHTQTLNGYLLHYGISGAQQLRHKKDRYAWLCARTYAHEGKAASWVKRRLAPLFDAAKSYLLLGGFLEGRRGWQLAAITFRYTARKYGWLHRHRARLQATGLPGIQPHSLGTLALLSPLPSSAAS